MSGKYSKPLVWTRLDERIYLLVHTKSHFVILEVRFNKQSYRFPPTLNRAKIVYQISSKTYHVNITCYIINNIYSLIIVSTLRGRNYKRYVLKISEISRNTINHKLSIFVQQLKIFAISRYTYVVSLRWRRLPIVFDKSLEIFYLFIKGFIICLTKLYWTNKYFFKNLFTSILISKWSSIIYRLHKFNTFKDEIKSYFL